MTIWGKVLWLFGYASDTEPELILSRLNQLSARLRQWNYRYEKERAEAPGHNLFTAIAIEAQCEQFMRDFKRTRLHRIYGWNVKVFSISTTRYRISLQFSSGDVDASYLIAIWPYDLNAVIKACDGRGGLNNDELDWMIKEATKVAKEIKAK